MASEIGTQVVEVRSQEGVVRCEGERIRRRQSERGNESGAQVEDVRSQRREHEVEKIYNCFVNNLYAGQKGALQKRGFEKINEFETHP